MWHVFNYHDYHPLWFTCISLHLLWIKTAHLAKFKWQMVFLDKFIILEYQYHFEYKAVVLLRKWQIWTISIHLSSFNIEMFISSVDTFNAEAVFIVSPHVSLLREW